jgi:DNA-binding transcriptional ArsR family regulator
MYVEPDVRDQPRLGVHPSVAIEIDWALSSAHRFGRKPVPPLVENLYRSNPLLADRVTSLWGPGETLSYPGYLELSALAHHGGLLFSTDSDRLLGSLDALCADPPSGLTLAAETPDDRVRVLRRLAILRRSPARRRKYLAVVDEVWSALRPDWERDGLAAVQRELATRQHRLEQNPPWHEFVPTECEPFQSFEDLVRALGTDGELALVVAYFTNTGLVVDLPGLVVVGVGTEDPDKQTRGRSELLARRLKAIADPTRLAILARLAGREMTVSQIAERFSLAQPTVSNHVKLLRDAGFVTPRNDGRHRYLVVVPDVLDGLERELRDLLGH